MAGIGSPNTSANLGWRPPTGFSQRGGAELLAQHPGLLNRPFDDPRMIKGMFGLSLVGGIVALSAMMFGTIRVPRRGSIGLEAAAPDGGRGQVRAAREACGGRRGEPHVVGPPFLTMAVKSYLLGPRRLVGSRQPVRSWCFGLSETQSTRSVARAWERALPTNGSRTATVPRLCRSQSSRVLAEWRCRAHAARQPVFDPSCMESGLAVGGGGRGRCWWSLTRPCTRGTRVPLGCRGETAGPRARYSSSGFDPEDVGKFARRLRDPFLGCPGLRATGDCRTRVPEVLRSNRPLGCRQRSLGESGGTGRSRTCTACAHAV